MSDQEPLDYAAPDPVGSAKRTRWKTAALFGFLIYGFVAVFLVAVIVLTMRIAWPMPYFLLLLIPAAMCGWNALAALKQFIHPREPQTLYRNSPSMPPEQKT
ncbi:MAG TPA: hypothetical protein VGG44_10905 [Tepidisphaeraceae bacterium]|jgi:cytochrome b561